MAGRARSQPAGRKSDATTSRRRLVGVFGDRPQTTLPPYAREHNCRPRRGRWGCFLDDGPAGLEPDRSLEGERLSLVRNERRRWARLVSNQRPLAPAVSCVALTLDAATRAATPTGSGLRARQAAESAG